uniref:RWD domain-containing protein 4A n=1 Tax=Caligus rogercresseyi TaxID=217165 RepID=C1BQH6_CALRO|nr:RWD domain-containing protein 4A [Caligus rogercresseyi]
MSEALELQSEEREVLKSIYEGDDQFSVLSDTQFQYKYGEDASRRSFVLQLGWPSEYPNEAPTISMDAFYNAHICPQVVQGVRDSLQGEIEQFLGMSMTYSLFEHVKENYETLIALQPEEEETTGPNEEEMASLSISGNDERKETGKKEKLTKAQKRRMWNRGGLNESERPRGWDWVDIIRHLSQTGYKDEEA